MSEAEESDGLIQNGRFKPSEYMRACRPELFSDTFPRLECSLDRDGLEYQLETLTSRKQEQDFEEFCRRLAEVEICPNLKPQTGPTGGGDSKVDAATYPVAPVLSQRCWWGTPAPPAQEPWGFAFSCKKDWKTKVRDDVAKIATLDRGFTKVFFITNQFTRDRDRAAKESELSKKYAFEVHILDRSWILNSIIEHRRERIPIDTLGLSGTEKSAPQHGPLDMSRQQELDDLLARLSQPEAYYGNDYALSLDYLNAALLSRGLEKPRHETDGLFQRARDLAKQHGYRGLIIRTAYNHAWTTLWWFDDAVALARIYADIEGHLPETPNAEDCELMANLWRLLLGAVRYGALSPEDAKLPDRLSRIRRELVRLSRDTSRPNNALHAKTELHLLDLTEGLGDPARARRAFAGLSKCLKRSVGLGTYPALELIDCLSKAGELYGNLPGYDSLFEEMRHIARKRRGDASEGHLLFERGIQMARHDRPKDALQYLGQARVLLFKSETRREAIRASLGCADAYSALGLHWAARMDAITALHGAMGTPELLDAYPFEAIAAALKLGWLELSLGRLRPFTTWYQIARGLAASLEARHLDVEGAKEGLVTQEGVLGCWFLNLDGTQLAQLRDLPEQLEKLGLTMARWALLYALGEVKLITEEWPDEERKDERIAEFFSAWTSQPATEQMPQRFDTGSGTYTQCETAIMGVTYHVKVVNELGPTLFAENLLGVIEAALATARWSNLAFIVDRVEFVVDRADDGRNPPSFELPPPPNPQVFQLTWKPSMIEWLNQQKRSAVTDYFKKALLMILLMSTIDPIKDLTDELDQWNAAGSFSRALGTSPISIAVVDILGRCKDGL